MSTQPYYLQGLRSIIVMVVMTLLTYAIVVGDVVDSTHTAQQSDVSEPANKHIVSLQSTVSQQNLGDSKIHPEMLLFLGEQPPLI